MAKRAPRKPRLGALFWVSALLVGSAVLRLGLEAGPAIAREAADFNARQDSTGNKEKPDPASSDETELAHVLKALKEREKVLLSREKLIEDRMQALKIADAAIDAKLVDLEAAENSLSATLALADGASENDLTRLTTVYEKMKAKESAALFETMDPAFAAGFLARMRPDAAAGILAKLSPEAGYRISVILAGRHAAVPKE